MTTQFAYIEHALSCPAKAPHQLLQLTMLGGWAQPGGVSLLRVQSSGGQVGVFGGRWVCCWCYLIPQDIRPRIFVSRVLVTGMFSLEVFGFIHGMLCVCVRA